MKKVLTSGHSWRDRAEKLGQIWDSLMAQLVQMAQLVLYSPQNR